MSKQNDKKDAMHQPHDQVFKNTFCNKENVQLINKSFVDPVGV